MEERHLDLHKEAALEGVVLEDAVWAWVEEVQEALEVEVVLEDVVDQGVHQDVVDL